MVLRPVLSLDAYQRFIPNNDQLDDRPVIEQLISDESPRVGQIGSEFCDLTVRNANVDVGLGAIDS